MRIRSLIDAAGEAQGAGRRPVPQGFTLIEMLVAVGAVALIALGLARVFGATSSTLRAGKRISAFNDTAALLERTMRADLAAITRDGFLVIVNENASDPSDNTHRTGPKLTRNSDAGPKQPRRIDQLMFFTQGKFSSARPPIHSSRVPSGEQARIWYGHGLKEWDDKSPPASPDPLKLDDFDDPNIGGPKILLPYFGQPGPNQYAADWTLLRRQDVLTAPSASTPPYPTGISWPVQAQWNDSAIQKDLQPAQSNLFVHCALGEPGAPQNPIPNASQVARNGDAPFALHPLCASGLVDIISTTLGDARAMILDAQAMTTLPPLPQVYDFSRDANGNAVYTAFDPSENAANASAENPSNVAMRRWMRYALPAPPRLTPGFANNAHGGRVHYQLAPADFLGTFGNGGALYPANQDFRRADQAMLTSSNLIPGCTSFIVEWSFGDTYKANDPWVMSSPERRRLAGQTVWHGLTRHADLNFDGTIDLTSNAEIAVLPYRNNGPAVAPQQPTSYPAARRGSANAPNDAYEVEYTLRNGNKSPVPWRLKPEAIQEGTPDGSLYTTFGYYDSSFAPPPISAATSGSVVHSNDYFLEFQPATMPVPWPRLIRVTVSLVDPSDPSEDREQTFQFVFEVPQTRDADVN